MLSVPTLEDAQKLFRLEVEDGWVWRVNAAVQNVIISTGNRCSFTLSVAGLDEMCRQLQRLAHDMAFFKSRKTRLQDVRVGVILQSNPPGERGPVLRMIGSENMRDDPFYPEILNKARAQGVTCCIIPNLSLEQVGAIHDIFTKALAEQTRMDLPPEVAAEGLWVAIPPPTPHFVAEVKTEADAEQLFRQIDLVEGGGVRVTASAEFVRACHDKPHFYLSSEGLNEVVCRLENIVRDMKRDEQNRSGKFFSRLLRKPARTGLILRGGTGLRPTDVLWTFEANNVKDMAEYGAYRTVLKISRKLNLPCCIIPGLNLAMMGALLRCFRRAQGKHSSQMVMAVVKKGEETVQRLAEITQKHPTREVEQMNAAIQDLKSLAGKIKERKDWPATRDSALHSLGEVDEMCQALAELREEGVLEEPPSKGTQITDRYRSMVNAARTQDPFFTFTNLPGLGWEVVPNQKLTSLRILSAQTIRMTPADFLAAGKALQEGVRCQHSARVSAWAQTGAFPGCRFALLVKSSSARTPCDAGYVLVYDNKAVLTPQTAEAEALNRESEAARTAGGCCIIHYLSFRQLAEIADSFVAAVTSRPSDPAVIPPKREFFSDVQAVQLTIQEKLDEPSKQVIKGTSSLLIVDPQDDVVQVLGLKRVDDDTWALQPLRSTAQEGQELRMSQEVSWELSQRLMNTLMQWGTAVAIAALEDGADGDRHTFSLFLLSSADHVCMRSRIWRSYGLDRYPEEQQEMTHFVNLALAAGENVLNVRGLTIAHMKALMTTLETEIRFTASVELPPAQEVQEDVSVKAPPAPVPINSMIWEVDCRDSTADELANLLQFTKVSPHKWLMRFRSFGSSGFSGLHLSESAMRGARGHLGTTTRHVATMKEADLLTSVPLFTFAVIGASAEEDADSLLWRSNGPPEDNKEELENLREGTAGTGQPAFVMHNLTAEKLEQIKKLFDAQLELHQRGDAVPETKAPPAGLDTYTPPDTSSAASMKRVLEVLNSAFQADPETMSRILTLRMRCDAALIDHPGVFVCEESAKGPYHRASLTPLGVLNGIMETLFGQRIAYAEDTEGRVSGFCAYTGHEASVLRNDLVFHVRDAVTQDRLEHRASASISATPEGFLFVVEINDALFPDRILLQRDDFEHLVKEMETSDYNLLFDKRHIGVSSRRVELVEENDKGADWIVLPNVGANAELWNWLKKFFHDCDTWLKKNNKSK